MPILFAVKKNYIHESDSEVANFDNDSFLCYFNYTANSTDEGKLKNLIQNALIEKQKDPSVQDDIYPVIFYAFSLTKESYEEFGQKYDKMYGYESRAKAYKEQKIKEPYEFKKVQLPLKKCTLIGYYYNSDDDKATIVTNADIKSKNLPEIKLFNDLGKSYFNDVEFQEKNLGETIISEEKIENKDEDTPDASGTSFTP